VGAQSPVTDPQPSTTAAFYARRGGRGADWWTLLHPPYTIWHLSYVCLGAALAPKLNWALLGATVLAFLLAVGVAAHVLDELHGRPLGTAVSDRALRSVATVSLLAAVVIGAVSVRYSGLPLVPFIAAGVILVLGYNLELFGGRLHTDLGFALAWGGFPALVGYLGQAPPLLRPASLGALAAAAAATALSYAQRQLSAPARTLRRRTGTVTGIQTMSDGSERPLDRATLLAPLEAALRALSLAMPLLAASLLLAHLG
jgi:hypothetical protein